MHRRTLLAVLGTGSTLLAGCAGRSSSDTETGTPTETAGTDVSLPDGIYVQPFRESMAMQGTGSAGNLRVAFMYTTPHKFWTLTGSELSKTPKNGEIHGMAVVWDEATGRIIPETGLSLEITRDGDLVSQEVIYPMLSQRMGYHYGGNFGLGGDGEYTARISVGAVPDAVALTGGYEGQFREPTTADIEFVFDDEQRDRVEAQPLDAYGQPGAVQPMEMGMLPQATAPARDALPGTVHGVPNSDDALLATGSLSGDAAARFGDADAYLYVSARTRYNGLVLPAMSLSATVTSDGSETYAGELTRTLDPDLGYHYGAPIPALETGDEVALSVGVPPQVSRHEGYERAFLGMPDVTVTV